MIRFPDSPAWCFLAKIAGEVKLESFWVSHGDTLFLAIYWYVVPDMTLWYTMCPFWSFLFLIFGILNLMIVACRNSMTMITRYYKSMEVSVYIIFRLSFSSWWCWICMHDSRFFSHLQITTLLRDLHDRWTRKKHTPMSSRGLASPVAVQKTTMSSPWTWMKDSDLQQSFRHPGGIRENPLGFEVTQRELKLKCLGVRCLYSGHLSKSEAGNLLHVSIFLRTFILKLLTYAHVSVCNAKDQAVCQAVCSFRSIPWIWAGWKELLHRRVDSRTAALCKFLMFCHDFMSCYDPNAARYFESSGKGVRLLNLVDNSQLIDSVSSLIFVAAKDAWWQREPRSLDRKVWRGICHA